VNRILCCLKCQKIGAIRFLTCQNEVKAYVTRNWINQQTELNLNSGSIRGSYCKHLENKFPGEENVNKGEQLSIEFSVLRKTEREILKTIS
jgi:hypothetical protein